jgi:hypothetical protein
MSKMPFAVSLLFELEIDSARPINIGEVPVGLRQFDVILEGRFQGPTLKGRVLAGVDRLLRTPDGTFRPDAIFCLQTEEGVAFEFKYSGIAMPPPELFRRIEEGKNTDDIDYYHRIAGTFTAPSGSLDWLNRIVVVGLGRLRPSAERRASVKYSLYEVK